MSGNAKAKATKAAKKQPRKDARTRRTHERLGHALLQLICEKPIDQVTVQEVLDHAAVGRSTFYQHFSDKEDLLLTQLEGFLEIMCNMLNARGEVSDRVAPVTEMFEHVAEQKRLYRAMADSGCLHDFYNLAEDYFARSIEQRLRASKRTGKMTPAELRARSVALSGSLWSLFRWWMDRGAKEPAWELDALFHQMVWKGMPLSDS
jgi:AcrR family transcriptional regulator